MDDRLQAANLQKTTPELEEVIGYLTTLRDAWREMLSQDQTTEPIPGGGLAMLG